MIMAGGIVLLLAVLIVAVCSGTHGAGNQHIR
jgi:hypothetical protein